MRCRGLTVGSVRPFCPLFCGHYIPFPCMIVTAVKRSLYEDLHLKQPGMEFASEMLLRAGKKNWRYVEIPISLRPVHPSHKPHLRPLSV